MACTRSLGKNWIDFWYIMRTLGNPQLFHRIYGSAVSILFFQCSLRFSFFLFNVFLENVMSSLFAMAVTFNNVFVICCIVVLVIPNSIWRFQCLLCIPSLDNFLIVEIADTVSQIP